MLYVRLAPTDISLWHIAPQEKALGDYPARGGFTAVRQGDAKILAKLDTIARSTPRTKKIAGSVEEGRITYVTRSRIWGFPDYTTVSLSGDHLTISARLRFGGSDLGVNAARVKGWLKELGL